MTTEAASDVQRAARHFRLALERATSLNLLGLSSFPAGACGDTCRLLAEYLRGKGLGQFGLVTAWRRPEMISHAWLTLDGLIVDITADQFAEMNDPVTVAYGTPWHASWDSEPPQWQDVGLAYYADWSGAASDYTRLATAADESIPHESNE